MAVPADLIAMKYCKMKRAVFGEHVGLENEYEFQNFSHYVKMLFSIVFSQYQHMFILTLVPRYNNIIINVNIKIKPVLV